MKSTAIPENQSDWSDLKFMPTVEKNRDIQE